MRRERAKNDPDTVHIWVCRIRGTQREVAARAPGYRAVLVQCKLGKDGAWNDAGTGTKHRYDAGPDTGIIDLVPIRDAVGLVVQESNVTA